MGLMHLEPYAGDVKKYYKNQWSGWQDLNLRLLRPERRRSSKTRGLGVRIRDLFDFGSSGLPIGCDIL